MPPSRVAAPTSCFSMTDASPIVCGIPASFSCRGYTVDEDGVVVVASASRDSNARRCGRFDKRQAPSAAGSAAVKRFETRHRIGRQSVLPRAAPFPCLGLGEECSRRRGCLSSFFSSHSSYFSTVPPVDHQSLSIAALRIPPRRSLS